MSQSRAARWAILLGAVCQLCFHAAVRAECGKEPGDFEVTVEVDSGPKGVDLGDALLITAKPPVPRKIVRMEVLLNGTRYPMPNSSGDVHEIPIERLRGSRQLALVGIPLKSGLTTLEINAFDDQQHCGYGRLAKGLSVRSAEEDFAIVIGVNVTKASSRKLNHARNDAYDIARYLINDLKLKAANVWLFTDNQAEAARLVPGVRAVPLNGPDDIMDAFKRVGESISVLSSLYFFFSGHQFVLDSESSNAERHFLMLPNSTLEEEEEEQSRLSWSAVMNKLRAMGAYLDHGVIILDACYSGSGAGGSTVAIYGDEAILPETPGMKTIGRLPRRRSAARAQLPESMGLLASSRSTDPSYELTSKPHGAFTQALLDVAADAKAARVKLSLRDAVEGTGTIAGARERTRKYVSNDYGPTAKQEPTHTPLTEWMMMQGTWVP